MSKVVVYVSEVNEPSRKVIELLNEYKITFEMKNVTEDKTYLQELQTKGIYGTPATEIDGEFVLGYQKNKLKYALGLDDVSHYSSLFDGFNS
ncbi:glutaredoxin domain-containing protein [Oceanobacillus iheyensis]|uniref:glutaredoxin domain-containing protein n=1 Tax=Oceanobacillus iheyensis TaxID=182710 RepID=UPI00363B7FFA